MDLGIQGKNVLVTGATRGTGKAIALAFAEEDCKVSVIARSKDKLEELVKEMGGEHSYLAIDLMEKDAPNYAMKELIKKNGNYEIVVHNVGGLYIKESLLPSEDWFKVLNFNVGIAIDINRIVVPPMQENKWGRIIHISSISGKNLRGSPSYACAKAYLNAYTQVIGRSLAKDGIVVSALMAGSFYSKGGAWDENSEKNSNDKEAFYKKRADFLRHHHAVERFGTPEEIAPFALFMASKYVTFAQGSLINIDGGTM